MYVVGALSCLAGVALTVGWFVWPWIKEHL